MNCKHLAFAALCLLLYNCGGKVSTTTIRNAQGKVTMRMIRDESSDPATVTTLEYTHGNLSRMTVSVGTTFYYATNGSLDLIEMIVRRATPNGTETMNYVFRDKKLYRHYGNAGDKYFFSDFYYYNKDGRLWQAFSYRSSRDWDYHVKEEYLKGKLTFNYWANGKIRSAETTIRCAPGIECGAITFFSKEGKRVLPRR